MSIYKGDKLVAGRSVGTYLVRRPAWNQAVEISTADLVAGYTAPSDGIVVGAVHNTSLEDYYATINGVNRILIISRPTINNYTIARPISISVTLNKGDTLGCTAPSAADIIISPSLVFVPFEDSAVSESGIEGITSELIRNLHDPDWSKIQHYTSVQLAENITIPARGIFICTAYPISVSPASIVYLKINGKIVDWSFRDNANGDIRKFNFSGPVCKGDVVTVTQHIDGSNTIAFVPYKAQ